MIKEEKNVDFYTSGKELSEQDFVRISEWIRKTKGKVNLSLKRRTSLKGPTPKILSSIGRTHQ